MPPAEGVAVPFPLPLFSFLGGSRERRRSPRLRARRNEAAQLVSLVGLPVSTGRVQLRFLLSVLERVRAHCARMRAARVPPSRAARERVRSGGSFSEQTSAQASAWEDALPFGSLFEYASRGSVVPLVADRVALPERAGTVDMVDALPPDLREIYGSADAGLC